MSKYYVGQKVRINDKAPAFGGFLAYVAYIGTEGVSVYLDSDIIEDCICLKEGEFEPV